MNKKERSLQVAFPGKDATAYEIAVACRVIDYYLGNYAPETIERSSFPKKGAKTKKDAPEEDVDAD